MSRITRPISDPLSVKKFTRFQHILESIMPLENGARTRVNQHRCRFLLPLTTISEQQCFFGASWHYAVCYRWKRCRETIYKKVLRELDGGFLVGIVDRLTSSRNNLQLLLFLNCSQSRNCHRMSAFRKLKIQNNSKIIMAKAFIHLREWKILLARNL